MGIDSVSLRGEMKGGNQREQGTGRGNETGPFSNWFASLTPVFCLAALPSPVPRPPPFLPTSNARPLVLTLCFVT